MKKKNGNDKWFSIFSSSNNILCLFKCWFQHCSESWNGTNGCPAIDTNYSSGLLKWYYGCLPSTLSTELGCQFSFFVTVFAPPCIKTTLAAWPWWHDYSQARGSLRPQETILLQGIIHCPAVLRHILQPKPIVSGYNSSLCVLGILFISWGHAADSCVPFVIKMTKVVRRLCWGWPHLLARWGQQTVVVARRVSGV